MPFEGGGQEGAFMLDPHNTAGGEGGSIVMDTGVTIGPKSRRMVIIRN
jgi:hypothetical protein